ncbi:hypothetical protein BJ742DRAFT_826009 [Cladochytrium replicatum]|nr:hypothetical protein BJ742DRAFT_826009 [Cladochytrium replicatum]
MKFTNVLAFPRGYIRKPMTSKRGNKNYYKGTGTGRMGHRTRKGFYKIDPWQLRTWMVPEGLSMTPLRATVSRNADGYTRRAHTFRDYFRPDNITEAMTEAHGIDFWARCRGAAKRAWLSMTEQRGKKVLGLS